MSMGLSVSSLFLLSSCGQSLTNRVCFGDRCVNVEVVSKKEDLIRGLQFRESLPQDAGMLFVFDQTALHPFWMKDTKISLDIIWFNRQQQVVFIEHNAEPCKKDPCPSYNHEQPALYVLEINGGLARQWGIAVGDQAFFRLAKFHLATDRQ